MVSVSAGRSAAIKRVRSMPLIWRGRSAMRSRAARHDPRARELAGLHMDFLHAGSFAVGERDVLIDEYLRTMMVRADVRWVRGAALRHEYFGTEVLTEARKSGRGLVLTFMHHGQYDGALGALSRLKSSLGDVRILVDPDHLASDAPLWSKQHLAVVGAGGDLISAAVGTAGVVEMLRAGQTVAIATDVPGRTPLKFAHRDVLGASGAARAAQITGAPVVPMHCKRPVGRTWEAFFTEALLPDENEPFEAFAQRIVSVQEQSVLRWRSGSDLPLFRWNHPSGDFAHPPLHPRFPI